MIFTDPEVAAVGMTEAQAREAGHDVVVSTLDLPSGGVARTYTYEQDPRGELSVVFDRERRVMLGAWAVAPLASEWIHQAVLAIQAEIPLDVLRQTVPQFPSFSEAYLLALLQPGALAGPPGQTARARQLRVHIGSSNRPPWAAIASRMADSSRSRGSASSRRVSDSVATMSAYCSAEYSRLHAYRLTSACPKPAAVAIAWCHSSSSSTPVLSGCIGPSPSRSGATVRYVSESTPRSGASSHTGRFQKTASTPPSTSA